MNLPPVPSAAPPAPTSLWQGFCTQFRTDKYASFSGRAGRLEYWGTVLYSHVFTLPSLLLCGIGYLCYAPDRGIALAALTVGLLLWLLCVLLFTVPLLAVAVRRLHDVNISGWWMLLFTLLSGSGVAAAIHHLVLMINGRVFECYNLLRRDTTLSNIEQALMRSELKDDVSLVFNADLTIPYLLAVLLVIFLCLPGKRAVNRFGIPS